MWYNHLKERNFLAEAPPGTHTMAAAVAGMPRGDALATRPVYLGMVENLVQFHGRSASKPLARDLNQAFESLQMKKLSAASPNIKNFLRVGINI